MLAGKPALAIKQGKTAEAGFSAVTEMIDSMTNTAVILWLQTDFFGRDS